VTYTPKNLSEFIGQKRTVGQVIQVLSAAKLKGKPLPHILISGPAGTGKTTLARIMAAEMEQEIAWITPAAVRTNEDLFDFFQISLDKTKPIENAKTVIVFLDEMHRLPVQIEEDLYLPMENRVFIRKAGFGSQFNMPSWTLIGATTLPGKLSSPLIERFGLRLTMTKYSTEEMMEIVSQSAIQQEMDCSEEAIKILATRCRSNPRIANHLLERCCDVALVAGEKVLTEKVVLAAFELLGVDEFGLNDLDRTYLGTLYSADRSIGVNSLVPVLDVDKDTIQATIEPYLLERGLILLTARGRLLTPAGRFYVEKSVVPSQEIAPSALEAKGGSNG
jgi:Holliday junction DNA helicase RuvB